MENSLFKDETLILLDYFFSIKKPFNTPESAWSFPNYRLHSSSRWDPTS